MDPSEFHPLAFQLGRSHYLLLPKMNRAQTITLERRLAATGFADAIHISSSGFCWASFDPGDAVLPTIPSALNMEREPIPAGEILAKYVTSKRYAKYTSFRFNTRIESSRLWELLRGQDDCALAPDEHTVATFLLRRATGTCAVLTDFPTDGCTRKIYGGHQYFESRIDAQEAASTLRSGGQRRTRNSYLPRNGLLTLNFDSITPREMTELVGQFGPWCGFRPRTPKSSNGRGQGPISAPVV